MKKNNLFSEFDPVTEKQWKQKIHADLKGADYNETLIWQSAEGIDVRPFYTAENDLETYSNSLAESWKLGQRISSGDNYPSDLETIVIKFSEAGEIPKALLEKAMSRGIFIHLEMDFLSQEFIARVEGIFRDYAHYALNIDLLGTLSRTGNWNKSNSEDHAILQFLLQHSKAPYVCAVDTGLFQNAGANRIQQLAYGLLQANEYLNFGVQHGLDPKPFVFKTAIDGNYFFEIAKLRALRWLWDTLAAEYGLDAPCHIIAEPSLRNKTTFDYNSNLLRTTLECMSAIQGGADTVVNRPYDSHFKYENEFSSRIALNQLRILKHESYLDKVNNPADGSYYIESLTEQLAQKALSLFKELEASGGYYQHLRSGMLQKKIREQAKAQEEDFDAGNEKLVGANAYVNEEESVLDQLDFAPFIQKEARRTEVEPIVPKRLASTVEKERMKDG
ncbi:MAG: methylmalonyl-CoA mutase subunit beta [Bacteroidia bacterium]|nr:methylmalonyl-CoA mutase subunit beta [Bacteroidia bacterium]